MIRRLTTLALLLAGFAAPATAVDGTCSTLTVTKTDSGSFSTIDVDVTGSLADTPVFLAVGTNPGETTFPLVLGSITICMAQPFQVLPVGIADGNGDLSLSFAIPSSPVLGIDVLTQSAALTWVLEIVAPPDGVALSLETCTSNVSTLGI